MSSETHNSLFKCKNCRFSYGIADTYCPNCKLEIIEIEKRYFFSVLKRMNDLDCEYLGISQTIIEDIIYLGLVRQVSSGYISGETQKILCKWNIDSYETFVSEIVAQIEEETCKPQQNKEILESKIIFCIIVYIFNEFFGLEVGKFRDKSKEELVRTLMRKSIDYYDTLIHKPNLNNNYKTPISHKLLILVTLNLNISYCYELGNTFDEKLFEECIQNIKSRIIRAALLNEIYKEKKATEGDEGLLKALCNKIIVDIRRALYIQWDIKIKDADIMVSSLCMKIKSYLKEGIILDYHETLGYLFDEINILSSSIGIFRRGENIDLIPHYLELLEILNLLEREKIESKNRIEAYLRAESFYKREKRNIFYFSDKNNKKISVLVEFLRNYFQLDKKNTKKMEEEFRNEINEMISTFSKDKEKEILRYLI